jgi:hypothetical protein
MATPEWISNDNEIWQYDFTDDFIWLPDTFIDGLAIFVARDEMFQYDSEIETFQYVAEDETFQYSATKE